MPVTVDSVITVDSNLSKTFYYVESDNAPYKKTRGWVKQMNIVYDNMYAWSEVVMHKNY